MPQVTLDQAMQIAGQYHEAGRLVEAEAIYRQVVAQDANHAEAWHFLGMVTGQLGRIDLAIDLMRRAIAINPNYAAVYINLGFGLGALGRIDEAIAAHREGLRLRPDFFEGYNNLGNALKDAGRLDEAITRFREALQRAPDYVMAHNNLIYTLHFHPDYDGLRLREELRAWNRQHAEPLLRYIRPHANDRNPARRLRIGYVSADLRDHAVGRFMLPLLTAHDRATVQVFCYADGGPPDSTTERLRSRTDVWRPIAGLNDDQVAEAVRRDRIDILVDLALHSGHNRLLVFARKPAPVQVTYLGYCSTTGMDAMDYRFTDPYLDPPGTDEGHYSEISIRLPETYWCYSVHPAAGMAQDAAAVDGVGIIPALRTGHVTFGCLNNFCKVSSQTLETWARLMQAVARSRLILHAASGSHHTRVTDLLAQRGIAPERIEFVGRVPTVQYFQQHHRIDICLDPFPYAGGTTTCDALWMGVPVISLAGRTAVGRGGVSILSNVGLGDLIATTEAEYVQIATRLAQDIPRLKDLRATLRQRMRSSPLMAANRFARGVESAYRKMWERWCAWATLPKQPTV